MPTGSEPTSGTYYIHVKKGIRILYPRDTTAYYVRVFTWDNGRQGTISSADNKYSWTYNNNGPYTLEALLADPEIGNGRASDRLWTLNSETPRIDQWHGGVVCRKLRKSRKLRQSKQSRQSKQ